MLASRVKGESGDAVEDINEILFFCCGLTSGESGTSPHPPPPGYLTSALKALTRAVLDVYSRGKQIQSFDDVTGCLREALKTCSPDFHQVPLDLANLLAVRFLVHHVDDDYEEAKVLLDRITFSLFPEDHPCSCRIQATALIAVLGHARLIANSNPEISKRAASGCRLFLDHRTLFGDPLHPAISVLLISYVERRSNHIGPTQIAQAALSGMDPLTASTLPVGTFGDGVNGPEILPLAALLPMSLDEKINHLRDRLCTARLGTENQRSCLKDLVHCYNIKIFRTHDTTFIDEAIKYNKRFLWIAHPDDKSKFVSLSNFGGFLSVAFDRTKNAQYLDESIDVLRLALKLDSAQQTHFVIIERLIKILLIRWKLSRDSRRRQVLDEVIDLFTLGAKDPHTMDPYRFELACYWAHIARIFRHDSLLTAYKNAMSLMKSSLVFAPTLPIQHDRLVEKQDLYKTPLNFASYHIRAGQLERAIEVLEQGRALLWSEMRGLHTSIDQLRADEPELVDQFNAVNQKLEKLTTSTLPNGRVGMDDGGIEDEECMVLFADLMAKQHKLLKERDVLISKIRGSLNFPGSEKFLSSLSFDTLRSAASHGPVIVINHCKWRSDIIIILHDSLPSLITTSHTFFGRANELKEQLLERRQSFGSDSKTYRHTLTRVLNNLYELVGKPVIKRLSELGIPEKSRVWWCPTSVFGYLPLHAMGPIPSAGKGKRYFSDLYTSSYTPTLTALITSRNSGAQNLAQNISPPNMLLVGVPGPSLPGASREIQAIQSLNLPVTSLILQNATRSAVLNGLRKHQFCHFVCHGVLNPEKPFSSALVLYNEERLTLLDIVRSRLPAGECAFLAMCNTAELSGVSMPDEVLHLSAAVQYSGFRSVIGTMWEMADEDGQYLVEGFYESMFSDKRKKVPYHERSAEALADAVRMLRERRVSVERWVNYIHFGA
jgi:CHAT domain-containing protein